MFDKLPTNNEKEPVSYEQALEAAKTLRAAGIEDPFSGQYEDPAAQLAWDTIQEWGNQKNLFMAGGYTAEKATDRVLYEKLLLEAGYNDRDVLQALKTDLRDELAMATDEGNEEAVEILRNALGDIQGKLEAVDPRERTATMIREKIKQAEAEISEGKFLRAIGTIFGILTNKQFANHITDEERRHYLELMNETSRQAQCPVDENFQGFPKNWKRK